MGAGDSDCGTSALRQSKESAPESYCRSMNAADVRSTSFLIKDHGYDVTAVRSTLHAIAGTLDAGSSPKSVIDEARFRTWTPIGSTRNGYDIQAVDWYLASFLGEGQLIRPPVDAGDPWCVDPVVNQFSRPDSDPAARKEPLRRHQTKAMLAQACNAAWQRIDDLPGTRLEWGGGRTGGVILGGPWPVSARREQSKRSEPTLLTSLGVDTVAVGDETYRLVPAPEDDVSFRLAEAAYADTYGNHQAVGRWSPESRSPKWLAEAQKFTKGVRACFAESESRLRFTVSGPNFARRCATRITFADYTWLRFLVRGTKQANAVMTAIRSDGTALLRLRADNGYIEVVFPPDLRISSDLMAIAAIAASSFDTYFETPAGGGGG